MPRKHKCNRCGYVWELDGPKYCLRCYSKDIRHFRPLRDSISGRQRRISKSVGSTRNRFSNKFAAFRDYMIDLWATVRGFVFIILVFIFFLLLAIVYISTIL